MITEKISLVKSLQKWNEEQHTRNGCIRDADTLLADIVEENAMHGGMQESGTADELFEIWLGSSCKPSVESLFYLLTGKKFDEFLEICDGERMRKPILRCNRCGSIVEKEKELDDYPYYCPGCDENMFSFEVYEDES